MNSTGNTIQVGLPCHRRNACLSMSCHVYNPRSLGWILIGPYSTIHGQNEDTRRKGRRLLDSSLRPGAMISY